YSDLIRLRSGDASSAPDAVVYPQDHDEVAAVLDACAAARVAVTPYGGGTSVVGGVEPLREGFAAAISLDLARMDRLTGSDLRSLTATFGPGVTGPRAEAALAARGLTLGHFPQSFEYATIGGFVATRSAGQASTGYGRIDELVRGLRCATPAGELSTRVLPASAAGPSLRELVVGSEGILGVITEATLAVRPVPEARRYEGWSFRSFEEGCEAFRAMEQGHVAPDVARLSDEHETRVTLSLASSGSTAERVGKAYLRLRGHEGGCLAILGWEGPSKEVEARRSASARVARSHGGLPLGERPGQAWLRGRYAGPYLRDELLDRGVLVETLETAATWTALPGLYAAVGDALRAALASRGTPPIVMCHVSHLYGSGASLYFTAIARRETGDATLDQWGAAKRAASDAIIEAGGTITHHHAVGADHAPWMEGEVGTLGLEVLAAAKERLDPAGIMNPGKLLPRGRG
ncbi:MAG TPA: FAD-binding oxidoreductase, partial [Thermoleophilaceae bacterium]|nr:FAD-binding oxidoreductase [Thermoleophilaceae bacterium]